MIFSRSSNLTTLSQHHHNTVTVLRMKEKETLIVESGSQRVRELDYQGVRGTKSLSWTQKVRESDESKEAWKEKDKETLIMELEI